MGRAATAVKILQSSRAPMDEMCRRRRTRTRDRALAGHICLLSRMGCGTDRCRFGGPIDTTVRGWVGPPFPSVLQSRFREVEQSIPVERVRGLPRMDLPMRQVCGVRGSAYSLTASCSGVKAHGGHELHRSVAHFLSLFGSPGGWSMADGRWRATGDGWVVTDGGQGANRWHFDDC